MTEPHTKSAVRVIEWRSEMCTDVCVCECRDIDVFTIAGESHRWCVVLAHVVVFRGGCSCGSRMIFFFYGYGI